MRPRPASPRSRTAMGGAALLLAVAAGCAPSGPGSTGPTAPSATAGAAPTTAAPTSAASPTPVATVVATPARPSGTLAWPATFDVAFEEASYFSSPPFAIRFTIDVSDEGWFSGHLHADFFDLLRFDGVPHTGLPTEMLAFGDPRHFRGPEGDVPVEGLTPAEAADLVEKGQFFTVTNREDEVELLGLAGVRIDVASAVPNTPVFGGPGGNFGLGPQMPVRLTILDRDGALFLVLVLARPGGLDPAWDRAQDLLETLVFVD